MFLRDRLGESGNLVQDMFKIGDHEQASTGSESAAPLRGNKSISYGDDR